MSPPPSVNTLAWLAWPWWEVALGLELGSEIGVTERDRRVGKSERALLCCMAQIWTEEGDLQCGCPHSLIHYKHIWYHLYCCQVFLVRED